MRARARAHKGSGPRAAAGAGLCALTLVAAACGSSSGRGAITVSAAASLQHAFGAYARQLERPAAGRAHGLAVRYSFAGSDLLAAQIEAGATPDVFASADTALPDHLHAAGLVEPPVPFASNTLVLAVPASTHAITGLQSLERAGETIAVGDPGVPVGAYTDALLARLPASERARILANVRDREPDVTGIVGKLIAGAADAGFLYRTDVLAARGALRAIALPASLRPAVAYAVAVVRGSAHRAQARAFVAGLLHGGGAADLRAAGFGPPPR